MKKLGLTAAVAGCLSVTALPAGATTTVYTVSDYDVRGLPDGSADFIHAVGFAVSMSDTSPKNVLISASAGACVDSKQLCSTVKYVNVLDRNVSVSLNGETYNLLTAEYRRGGTGKLWSTHILADNEVVYSYADSLGNFVAFVTDGYLNGSSPNKTIGTTLSCLTAAGVCSGSMFDSLTLSYAEHTRDGIVVRPNNRILLYGNNQSAGSIEIPAAFLGQDGNYNFSNNGVNVQLSVLTAPTTQLISGVSFASRVYALAVPEFTDAVPEPATWAMMLVGFGMVGAASRYRRKSAKTSIA